MVSLAQSVFYFVILTHGLLALISAGRESDEDADRVVGAHADTLWQQIEESKAEAVGAKESFDNRSAVDYRLQADSSGIDIAVMTHQAFPVVLLIGTGAAFYLPSEHLLAVAGVLSAGVIVSLWLRFDSAAVLMGGCLTMALMGELLVILAKLIGEMLFERKYRPARAQRKSEDTMFKFYHVAHRWPDFKDAPRDKDQNLPAVINDKEEMLHIPTVEEVTGREQSCEVTLDDIEGWLQRQGMTSGWTWAPWLPRERPELTLAVNIARFACFDKVKRSAEEPLVEKITAAEWAAVAPRVALFVRLDEDHDGMLTFDQAVQVSKMTATTATAR